MENYDFRLLTACSWDGMQLKEVDRKGDKEKQDSISIQTQLEPLRKFNHLTWVRRALPIRSDATPETLTEKDLFDAVTAARKKEGDKAMDLALVIKCHTRTLVNGQSQSHTNSWTSARHLAFFWIPHKTYIFIRTTSLELKLLGLLAGKKALTTFVVFGRWVQVVNTPKADAEEEELVHGSKWILIDRKDAKSLSWADWPDD